MASQWRGQTFVMEGVQNRGLIGVGGRRCVPPRKFPTFGHSNS